MTTTVVSGLLLELTTMENYTEELNTTEPSSGGGGGGSASLFPYPVWLMPVILGIMVLVGVVGNLLVIFVIVRASQRTVTNYYIFNLAVADILFLVFCAPKTAEDYSATGFHFGGFMCKIVLYMQYVTSHSTCCLLAAMSMDRFQAIVRPLKSLKTRTLQTAVITSLFIWLSAFLLYIPYPLYFEIQYINWGGAVNPYCLINWPSQTVSDVYKVMTFLFPYALPLTVIAVCYSAMLRHLWQRVAPSDAISGPANAANAERNLRQKRKITWMVLTVVIVFAVCWFPTQFYSLWEYFGPTFKRTDTTLHLRTAGFVLSYANSCANPFIYAFLGENFRKSFRKAFHRCFKKAGGDRHGNGRGGATGGTQGSSSVAGPSTTRAGNVTQMSSMPSRTDV
ncbi:G-protein coupled receptor 54-like [Patiria miniata]|uniref:G-protein coupled receptors family 1 profile domain-containing protein n=1 Tax=Patiria miniata TaxID=46514 RepID=A0A913Z022_PATMI|nr:G-protein coupled receptor 54-like [Patiria miniata]